MAYKLKQRELNDLFIKNIGANVDIIGDRNKRPLYLKLGAPYFRTVMAYIYNCTDPPGGRSVGEYKIQMTDGPRGQKFHYEDPQGRTILLVGYATIALGNAQEHEWVLFETAKHRVVAYSANIQIYLHQLLRALDQKVAVCVKRNKETVVIARPQYLPEALEKRFEIDQQKLLERNDSES